MTEEQKKQIETLRMNGCGYTRIAQMIGISENTVKSFCRRNKLTGSVLPKMQYPVDSKKHFCLCCGAVVEQNPGIKYLRTLGFQATNDIFAENAWYFRNALVRANYNNLVKGIHETTEFLELFLRNLLCDEQNELHNRSMHVSGVYKDFQKADIQTNKADIQSGKADIGKRKADVSISEIYGNRINDFSSKTVEHIQMMYAELGTKQFFGRVDVQSATKLGHTRASELLGELVNANIIETISGHGKGKYRFCD